MAINDIILIAVILLFTVAGALIGFIKFGSKIVCFAGAAILTSVIGNLVASLLIGYIPALKDFASQNWFFNFLIVSGVYAILYLVLWLILKLIFNTLNKVVESNKPGKVINRILGAILGFAVGVLICDIYVWVSLAVSVVNSDVANWYINDCGLAVENCRFSLYSLFLKMNLHMIGKDLSFFPQIG